MGYLHDGHLSLVKRSLKETDVTVVSIFVNPIQFGPKEDLARYPRDLGRDIKLLREAGVDIVFYPLVKEMYPEPYCTYVDVACLGDLLCGAARPGHFRGVATIVAKLFNIIRPDTAYFGQKDAQQAVIVKKMAADLNMGTRVSVMPTVREKDGLALSSRNSYLGPQERAQAPVLHKALAKAAAMIRKGSRSSRLIVREMKKIIGQEKLPRIEYIAIVDNKTLRPADRIRDEVLIALAAHIGKTRLIDNIKVRVK